MMKQIYFYHNHPTIQFAAEELQRLLKKIEITSVIINKETDFNKNQIHILSTAHYNRQVAEDKQVVIHFDGYAIIKEEGVHWIIGNEPRSILYGVYAYCRKNYGITFIDIDKELRLESKEEVENFYIHEPAFARRGNVLETINDSTYLRKLIDWGSKNGLNEFFFTFFLWDQVKYDISEELTKRNYNVVLGGHSLKYLISLVEENESHSLESHLSFFKQNKQLQHKVIKKVIEVCTKNPIINRISLWPEDIGIDNENGDRFQTTYISFTETLKAELHKNNLKVVVEHIAYNAGLSWEMLERDVETSEQVDVLFAYWGRDYTQSIKADKHSRSYTSLLDWRKETKRKHRQLTVFEYYSDHFMLSELFPPLPSRIQKDLSDYKKLEIEGVVNLIVPSFAQKDLERYKNYPWQWIHHFNNYIFAGLSFGEDFEMLINDYFISMEHGDFYKKVIIELEDLVTRHTKWNFPLFPIRLMDVDKVQSTVHAGEIIQYLEKLHSYLKAIEIPDLKQTGEYDQACSHLRASKMNIYLNYLLQTSSELSEKWKAKRG